MKNLDKTIWVARQTFVNEDMKEYTNYCLYLNNETIDEISFTEIKCLSEILNKIVARDSKKQETK